MLLSHPSNGVHGAVSASIDAGRRTCRRGKATRHPRCHRQGCRRGTRTTGTEQPYTAVLHRGECPSSQPTGAKRFRAGPESSLAGARLSLGGREVSLGWRELSLGWKELSFGWKELSFGWRE